MCVWGIYVCTVGVCAPVYVCVGCVGLYGLFVFMYKVCLYALLGVFVNEGCVCLCLHYCLCPHGVCGQGVCV